MFNQHNFLKVFQTFSAIDLCGESGPPYPFEIPPTSASLTAAIRHGSRTLPLVFREAYVDPLLTNLDSILHLSGGDHLMIETLAGAAYQHAQPELLDPLHRFLAVVSDLFRSFLSRKRRAAAGFPLRETVPPLAMFQRSGANGPFTYTCDDITRYTGGKAGVVSLPASYAAHPILWASLAHETGGHDVIHADAGLLSELEEGARSLFGGAPLTSPLKLTHEQVLGVLWSYWMEEASADVYGVLNMGPLFGLNAAAYCSAVVSRGTKSQKPVLPSDCTASPNDPAHTLDPHPPALIRMALIAGAIDALENLDRGIRDTYVAQLDAAAKLCAPAGTGVRIKGILDAGAGSRVPLDVTIPLDEMQQAARKTGSYIASERLKTLDGKSIQDLETWDDFDEAAALHIADLLAGGQPATPYGDDAQVLAGATLALFAAPDTYAALTRGVEQALDLSFAQDPYWSAPKRARSPLL